MSIFSKLRREVENYICEQSESLLPPSQRSRKLERIAETVLQPCAAGKATHKRTHRGEYYADGTTAYACGVCGKLLP